MAPIIHLVRHAQGYHNLSEANQQIRDPDLTPLGKQQCEALCKKFPSHEKITHLVASPMRRTIYTCLLSFAPVAKRGRKVIALPDAQEVSFLPCDVGLEREKLKEEFGDEVDLSLVHEGWNDKSIDSKYYPDAIKLESRAREVRLWLRNLVQSASDDSQVVLVTHGGILHFLTQDWDGLRPGSGTGWENTECRSYEFKDPSGQDPDASLVETRTSWRQRRGSAKPLTPTEQTQLREAFAEQMEEANRKNGA
ncbi:histidine phosphatase superfamily [Pseudomassariella vexata]|uniref:Histidine phosphatase superfamily n=1 Tax=Pseudomassariella vexata TaxID=1141098 RepID=A0A1Y2DQU7_9PEZI|nr:histidine phosphatase superfamily [Pseudomassariella vexata]ORY61514.1 histidine phosphatase superfamily [Pseudomassariella vexata]